MLKANILELKNEDVLMVAEIEKECFSKPWSEKAIKPLSARCLIVSSTSTQRDCGSKWLITSSFEQGSADRT